MKPESPIAEAESRADGFIQVPNINPPMRHDQAGTIGPRVHVGQHVTHDGIARVLAVLREADGAMPVIGGNALGSAQFPKMRRCFPHPRLALPADFLKVGKPHPLGHGAERRTRADGL